MKYVLDICNIPGYKHYTDNDLSSLVWTTGGCKTVQDHNRYGTRTWSVALKPCHVAETVAAGNMTMITGILLLTQQVLSSYLIT